LQGVTFGDVAPSVPVEMVESLKFSAALPLPVAVRALAERYADRKGAAIVAREVLGTELSERGSESPT